MVLLIGLLCRLLDYSGVFGRDNGGSASMVMLSRR